MGGLIPSPKDLVDSLSGDDDDDGAEKRRRRGTIRKIFRLVKLTYLQSLQVFDEVRPAEDFLSVGVNYSGLADVVPLIKKPTGQQNFADLLATKFPYASDPQKRREQDSGWVLGKIIKEVLWDVVAWRIGVRELALNSFVFAPVSSMVTVPAVSPRPIWKVALETRETIPSSFRASEAWIVYEVTFDEGQTWHRINPLGKPTRFAEDGSVVPRVITIGHETGAPDPETKSLPPAEVRSARLRATLFSDTSSTGSDRLSPLLHQYRLLLYVRDGLTGSTPGEN